MAKWAEIDGKIKTFSAVQWNCLLLYNGIYLDCICFCFTSFFSSFFLSSPSHCIYPPHQGATLISLEKCIVCSSYLAFSALLHCLMLWFSMIHNSKTQLRSCHLRLLMCLFRYMLNSCWCCWESFTSVGLRNNSLKALQMTFAFWIFFFFLLFSHSVKHGAQYKYHGF